VSRVARGLSAEQAATIADLVKQSARDELEVTVRGQVDGSVRVSWRDRWSVDHAQVDHHGIITRPVPAGARPPGRFPPV
jgi:hypothetical protein